MPPTKSIKKGLRIPRTLLNAAKSKTPAPSKLLPSRTNSNRPEPLPNESPAVALRVRVIKCTDLIAADSNGTSDPFVVVSLTRRRFQTPVVKRTVNPEYGGADSTFDFPLFLSLADVIGALEIIIWDKDMLGKDYLGEAVLSLEDWFNTGRIAFDDEANVPVTLPLISSRSKVAASGSIQIKLGFVPPAGQTGPIDYSGIYDDLLQRTKAAMPTVLSAPPTRGIGTVRSRKGVPDDSESDLEDDGLSSDEEGDSGDEEAAAELIDALGTSGTPAAGVATTTPQPKTKTSLVSRLPRLPLSRRTTAAPAPATYSQDQSITMTPSGITPALNESGDYLSAQQASIPRTPSGTNLAPPTTPGGTKQRLPKFKRSSKDSGYNFSAGKDILGIVMLEIAGAADLPKLKNMTRTGWDMDPFVVISFGKKVFRTRVIRHSLNPQWEEKLLFHVRRYEAAFEVNLTVLDWDKFSGNDLIGSASLPLADMLANAPHPDPKTGLYEEGVENPTDMKVFKLPLATGKDAIWEAKHSPAITIRAKYQPYDALRQKFWRQYLKQYDTDETGTFSRLEITSMLDSLASTLSQATIDSFFTRNGKNPESDDLTADEAIQCLEEEVARPQNEKNLVSATAVEEYPGARGSLASGSVTPNGGFTPSARTTPGTPSLNLPDLGAMNTALGQMDFSGPDARGDAVNPTDVLPETERESNQTILPGQGPVQTAGPGNYLATAAPVSVPSLRAEGKELSRPSSIVSSDDLDELSGSSSGSDTAVERVINIKTCPLCHRPRLNSRAEMDIVTHLGVCASSDWNRVDRIVVGNYVTASQAQRKWYTKVLGKVSSGAYQLGANSANIIVQNRLTGQLEEEKMQGYVRFGIRLLYKGASSRMEGGRARRLLKSMSIKQGVKFDSPESAREIPAFIAFHNLKVDEILEPVSSFTNFNSFFYRKLKPDARPVAAPEDPTVLVSGADCRMMAFESVTEATKLWIKGREFTVSRLLGQAYADQASKYVGGALAIFRLAPQDYHRFHVPVDGTIGPMTYIAGEYYTVNPQAIRTSLDVYGENARKVVPIDSPQFGRVFAVCVGAMMVGSIVTTVEEGDKVAKGDEFGYFAFGGSTIVLLFEKGMVEWDEDLLLNGRACLETLVRVGMQVGRSPRPSGNSA